MSISGKISRAISFSASDRLGFLPGFSDGLVLDLATETPGRDYAAVYNPAGDPVAIAPNARIDANTVASMAVDITGIADASEQIAITWLGNDYVVDLTADATTTLYSDGETTGFDIIVSSGDIAVTPTEVPIMSATPTDFENLIKAMMFSGAETGDTRTFSFTLSDGVNTSPAAVSTVLMSGVADYWLDESDAQITDESSNPITLN